MEITIDRFGRLVIPKAIRDQLGLEPGSTLELEEREETLLLRPRRPEPDLIDEDGVVVFTGEPVGDLDTALERQRAARLAAVGSWKSR